MSAYNLLNGVYCSEDPWLLSELLRDQWGFDGLVVTDWGANDDRVAGIRAGQDLEMPGGHGTHGAAVLAALADGSLHRADLDGCVRRVLALLGALTAHGQVDRAVPWHRPGRARIPTPFTANITNWLAGRQRRERCC